MVMNGIGATPYSEWSWMSICASVNASMTLDHATMTMDASGADGLPHAIYFCQNNELNVINNSELIIKNYPHDALEWDGGNGGYNVNIEDSTFISDNNRSGFTGTFIASITNSDVKVINSRGNGSNGSHFVIADSTIDFSNNGSHGLSTGNLIVSNSSITANKNAYIGVAVDGKLELKNNSTMTVTENAFGSLGYAAVRLYRDYPFTVDDTCKLIISDNKNTGLYVRQGNLTIEDGAVVEIMRNTVTNNQLGGYGGGLYIGYGDNYDPTVIIPEDAKIYNNHATAGGDDIYVSEGVEGPQLRFGPVGADWMLDDCEHLIDGWYQDGADNRWSAHDAPVYAKLYTPTGEAVNGLLALKAAHGLAHTVTIHYLERETEKVLADAVTTDAYYAGTEVDLSEYLDKDIRGYRQVEVVTENAVIDGGEITMPSDDVVINVYYERNPILPILPGLEFPDADLPGLLNLEDHYAYIIGYDDGNVKPQNNITRAEVATIFFRLLTDDARAYYWSTDSGFSDVNPGDWYNNAVATMVNAGILNGYSDGTFKPNANITRAEFATIAARFLSNSYSLNDRFYDTEGHWAEPYINRAAEVGWINGYSDGSFKPDRAITRAEAVTLVNAVLGREPHEDHLLSSMVTWPDNPKSAWFYEDIQEATNSHDYVWASGNAYEIWTKLLENRNWAKLEKEWSTAYSAPGGNVMG